MRDSERRAVAAECAAIEREACWEAAARAAVRANTEVRVVRAALRRAGVAGDPDCPPMPSPVPVQGRSLLAVLADAERAAQQLDDVRSFLAAHRRREASRIARSVRARTAAPAPARPAPASPAATPSTATSERAPTPAGPGHQIPEPSPAVVAEIDRLLALVDDDAGPAELANAYAAAEEARRAPAFWLPQLARVVEELCANTARARRYADEAAAYLEGIAAIGVDPTDPLVSSVVAGLNEVVVRERDLSESLREDARLLIANGERAAAEQLFAERLRESLRADGFDVHSSGESGRYEVLELTRQDRPRHSARVSIGRGEIRHRTTVGRAPVSADHRRLDAEWCAAVDHSISKYGQQLDGSGISMRIVDSSPEVEVELDGLDADDVIAAPILLQKNVGQGS